MSLPDAFDAPIVETVGGRTYSLPILDVDDLAAISREALNDQKLRALADVPLQNVVERQNVEAYYGGLELDVEDLCREAKKLGGSRRFVARSLRKCDPTADPDAFVRAVSRERGQRGVAAMAVAVSGLWAPAPKPEAKKADPNAGAATGSDPAAANTSTGSTPA